MPTIIASPNPVGIYSVNVPTFTIVSWDTETPSNGFVEYSENGGDPSPLGSAAPSGSVPLQVKLGSTYRLSLKTKTVSGGLVEVASAMVATFDLRQQMAAGFSQAFVPQLGMPAMLPQMISGLVVRPGIDMVQISFRTTLPTIPTTELRDEAGNWVDGKLPLFGGLRTRHNVEFGFEEALALNHKHSFRIEAFGPTGDPASPNKAVITGEFMTGRRHADVMWEVLDVRNDSDSGGAGELDFLFRVGDVATGAALGPPSFWEGDIVDRNPPVDLGIVMPLTDAHRELWLEVIGDENDQEPYGGIAAIGAGPNFTGPGAEYFDDGDIQRVSLTIVVSIDTDPGRWMIPFELNSPEWPLAFKVTGHLAVRSHVGSVIAPKMTKSKPPPKRDAMLTRPGDMFGLATDVSGTADLVALGADGSVYHRRRNREGGGRSDRGEWSRIELPGVGKPVVVASGPDKIDLVDLDPRGGVLHCEFDPAKPKRPKWRKLGGNFRQVVPVAESAKRKGMASSLALFGIAQDGSLHVHEARGQGREWTAIGDQPVRAVAPVSGAAAALLAVGGDGALLHFGRRNGRWRPQAIAGKAPGAATQLLTASVVERVDPKDGNTRRRDLVIGALDSDRQAQMLLWPDYPNGTPEPRWQQLGDLQELMLSPAEAPKRGRKSVKSKG